MIMERTERDIYLRTVEPEQDNRTFNGDNQAEVDAFFRMMKADEATRKEKNEAFISNIEKDLEGLHEKIVEDMKTKSRAIRLRKLVASRLFVLTKTIETDERFADRWEEAIDTAKYLLDKIDREFDCLPDELYSNPPSLQIQINTKPLIELFETWKSNKFGVIDSATDFCYFNYAFRGEPIPPDKQPYRPIRVTTSKSKFQRFLREVLPIEQKTIPANIKKKVTCLFVDKNGKPLRLYNE
jgi:hypothetical protein